MASFKRRQAALTRSSGGTDSRTSTTVCSEGSKAMQSFNRTSRVQFTKARRWPHRTVEPDQERAVEYAVRSSIGISTPEVVFNTVAKRQFVAKNLLITSGNRLASDKARVRAARLVVNLDAGGGCVHFLSIGRAEQRARLRTETNSALGASCWSQVAHRSRQRPS